MCVELDAEVDEDAEPEHCVFDKVKRVRSEVTRARARRKGEKLPNKGLGRVPAAPGQATRRLVMRLRRKATQGAWGIAAEPRMPVRRGTTVCG